MLTFLVGFPCQTGAVSSAPFQSRQPLLIVRQRRPLKSMERSHGGQSLNVQRSAGPVQTSFHSSDWCGWDAVDGVSFMQYFASWERGRVFGERGAKTKGVEPPRRQRNRGQDSIRLRIYFQIRDAVWRCWDLLSNPVKWGLGRKCPFDYKDCTQWWLNKADPWDQKPDGAPRGTSRAGGDRDSDLHTELFKNFGGWEHERERWRLVGH